MYCNSMLIAFSIGEQSKKSEAEDFGERLSSINDGGCKVGYEFWFAGC